MIPIIRICSMVALVILKFSIEAFAVPVYYTFKGQIIHIADGGGLAAGQNVNIGDSVTYVFKIDFDEPANKELYNKAVQFQPDDQRYNYFYAELIDGNILNSDPDNPYQQTSTVGPQYASKQFIGCDSYLNGFTKGVLKSGCYADEVQITAQFFVSTWTTGTSLFATEMSANSSGQRSWIHARLQPTAISATSPQNSKPFANAAPEAVISSAGIYQTNTPLVVSGTVSDFDGDWVTYTWMLDSEIICNGSIQTLEKGTPCDVPVCFPNTLTLGLHSIRLELSDGINNTVIKEASIQIVDRTEPMLAPVASTNILWPPNHEMTSISIATNANDNSGTQFITASISSNEPVDGSDDGEASPDWTEPEIDQVTGTVSFQLRSERIESGNGRIYSIGITAVDEAGNSQYSTIDIIVPLNSAE